MKLKPGGKIAIFLLIGAIAYFVIKPRIGSNKGNEVPTTTATTGANEDTKAAGNDATKSSGSGDNTENRAFNYTPEKPVNPTLKGVVEVGATGFNSFVINMDQQKRWEIVSKDFGESLAYEGLATTEDIRAGLKKYLSGMFDKGVSKNNMHFVI
jgi:hypothetical protein